MPSSPSRTRDIHASTAIADNQLTLEQVRALEEGENRLPREFGSGGRLSMISWDCGMGINEP